MDTEALVKIALGMMSIGTPVVLFLIGWIRKDTHDMKLVLKHNTESTVTLATRMVGVDEKMANMSGRVDVLGKRSHDLAQDMAVVKYAIGVDKRGIGNPGDD